MPVIAAAERARLDAILDARDRDFPRRDPANTAALETALDAYVRELRAARGWRRRARWRRTRSSSAAT
jgi:hypothetical protein